MNGRKGGMAEGRVSQNQTGSKGSRKNKFANFKVFRRPLKQDEKIK